jgi:hypothetical protein
MRLPPAPASSKSRTATALRSPSSGGEIGVKEWKVAWQAPCHSARVKGPSWAATMAGISIIDYYWTRILIVPGLFGYAREVVL